MFGRHSYDYLEIRDGGRPDSPLVGRYCGSDLPPEYATSSNQAYVRFVTDYSVTRGGFRIRYELGEPLRTGLISSYKRSKLLVQS